MPDTAVKVSVSGGIVSVSWNIAGSIDMQYPTYMYSIAHSYKGRIFELSKGKFYTVYRVR